MAIEGYRVGETRHLDGMYNITFADHIHSLADYILVHVPTAWSMVVFGMEQRARRGGGMTKAQTQELAQSQISGNAETRWVPRERAVITLDPSPDPWWHTIYAS